MPSTGTTLCHPQNWLCRFDAQLSSRHLALNSPLGHFNGDQRTPLHQTHETHGDDKSSIPPTATWLSPPYGEHNPSHTRRHTLPSQPSQPSHESISSPYRLFTHNLTTSLAAQTTKLRLKLFYVAHKNQLLLIIPQTTRFWIVSFAEGHPVM